ncbi:MAG: DUF1998 domain-containing protein [Caldilineaceae bacterium]|nr:DUF1998 domain-containing protein [Caldilineaceae bacterium]MBP8121219.1 DUF1998 domain-containing protein [Caldilineaceae bacterium]MBP9071948.1 DUF1998 domain-containing protein [Caldilineaceae bacterium]
MTELKPRVGDVRPSQLLYTYGVGSIIDLPDFSVLVMGLDDWPANADAMRTISEERLLAAVRTKPKLARVDTFRAPPVDETTGRPWDPQSDMAVIGVPVATFPRWMVCPACRLLASIDSGHFTIKSDRWRSTRRYVHEGCNKTKSPAAVPARFLIACEDGHLDDFPWVEFVHGASGSCEQPLLRLFEKGPSGEARDLVVRCEACDNKERRLAEAFGRQNRLHLPLCRGRHPHLRTYDPDGCDRQVYPMVLGASNAWFPQVLSSIAIPGGTQRLDQLVSERWAFLQTVSSPEVLTAFRQASLLSDFSRFSDSDLWSAIQRRRQPTPDAENADDLRLPEWQVFTSTQPVPNTPDFRLRVVDAPPAFASQIERVVLVERLREVKTLTGFTRIDSPGEGLDVDTEDEIRTIAPLSRHNPTWLPAVEVRGEGIFLQFNEAYLAEWLQNSAVRGRARTFGQAHLRWHQARDIDLSNVTDPGMRYVFLHSFAHALMRQMALESGYAAASISERIYARNPDVPGGPMAGILFYTAASDSEGTLGGLVRLGETRMLERNISGALESVMLCASDPTCAEHEPSNDGMSLHAAACHACLFAPETSCERGNRYLDRSVLVETFAGNDLAFFGVAP